jgi:hypothetical protein
MAKIYEASIILCELRPGVFRCGVARIVIYRP